VYSLGVLLFELLTGRLPYAPRQTLKGTRSAMEEAITSIDALRPATLAFNATIAAARSTTPKALQAALKGDLDAIVLKALSKAPADRYSTVAAMADDIHRHLNHEVVTAQPTLMRYRVGKFLARYKLATALAGLAAASLVVGSGVALWQAKVAAAHAQQATEEAATATALKDFMVGVLSSSSPNQAEAATARQRTADQLLDLARNRALDDKTMAPDARIAVLRTLQSIYGSLYLIDDARKTSLAALDAVRARGAKRSDADIFTVAAFNLMPIDPDKSLALTDEAEALATPNDPHPPDVRMVLHMARSDVLEGGKGELKAAIEAIDRAIALHRVFPETTEPSMPRLLSYKAILLFRAGRFGETQQVAEEGMRVERTNGSGKKNDSALLESLLGAALGEQLALNAAEAALERSRALGEEVGGVAFAQALYARCHRARLLARASADPRALEIALGAKAIADKGRGATDEMTAPRIWQCVADVQFALGDIKAALQSFNQLAAIDTQQFGANAVVRHLLNAQLGAATGDRTRLNFALTQLEGMRLQENPVMTTHVAILRARHALLGGDQASAKALLSAVPSNQPTLSGLQASVESATLWQELGQSRRAAEIAEAALSAIDRAPEKDRLKALRDKLLKLKA
jgi:eukaryotic-like serine/threonine-protein kinase